MEFFKKLFTGGAPKQRGQFYYVQPKGCTEVVRVRIDTMNELSQNDDNSGYFVRKNVRGTGYKCTRSAELYIAFDSQKRIQETEVTDGTLVTEADYDAWMLAEGQTTST